MSKEKIPDGHTRNGGGVHWDPSIKGLTLAWSSELQDHCSGSWHLCSTMAMGEFSFFPTAHFVECLQLQAQSCHMAGDAIDQKWQQRGTMEARTGEPVLSFPSAHLFSLLCCCCCCCCVPMECTFCIWSSEFYTASSAAVLQTICPECA